MSKKKVTKKTSSVETIAILRKSVPAFSVGALGQKVIIYLIENKGTSFTSYEIHSVVGNENTTDKAVRDFMRKMGLNKNTSFLTPDSNQGVVRVPEQYGTNLAMAMGKQGMKHTYCIMDVK